MSLSKLLDHIVGEMILHHDVQGGGGTVAVHRCSPYTPREGDRRKIRLIESSVGVPDPYLQDPHVYGPPGSGSGSISHRQCCGTVTIYYGSSSGSDF